MISPLRVIASLAVLTSLNVAILAQEPSKTPPVQLSPKVKAWGVLDAGVANSSYESALGAVIRLTDIQEHAPGAGSACPDCKNAQKMRGQSYNRQLHSVPAAR